MSLVERAESIKHVPIDARQSPFLHEVTNPSKGGLAPHLNDREAMANQNADLIKKGILTDAKIHPHSADSANKPIPHETTQPLQKSNWDLRNKPIPHDPALDPFKKMQELDARNISDVDRKQLAGQMIHNFIPDQHNHRPRDGQKGS